MAQDAVILVYSTSHAIKIEKALKAAGVACRMIPVPRHLSSDCGVCVRIPAACVEETRRLLDANHIEVQGIIPL